jgi:hypothetical protein
MAVNISVYRSGRDEEAGNEEATDPGIKGNEGTRIGNRDQRN